MVREGATTCSSCGHRVPVEVKVEQPQRVWHWPWGEVISGVGAVPVPAARPNPPRGIAEGRP